jgi:hypothetical protein
MRVWYVVGLALSVAGCSFDTTSLVRTPAHAAPSRGDAVGLYSDAGSAPDSGEAMDTGAPPIDAASPVSAADSSAPRPDMDSGKVREAEVSSHQPPDVNSQAADARVEDAAPRDASTPPPPAADAAMPASDAGGQTSNPVRMGTLQLLKAAQLSGNDRVAVALLAELVAQAKTGAELAQVLAPLDTDGICAIFNRVNCVMTCGVVATRCALCNEDADCRTELQHVCGVSGPNCR